MRSNNKDISDAVANQIKNKDRFDKSYFGRLNKLKNNGKNVTFNGYVSLNSIK